MSKKIPEKGLIKEGTISGLKYQIFDRGNIQITDGNKIFRKDRTALKSALSNIDYMKMVEGDVEEIPGAGDTDPLLICMEKDGVRLQLKRKIPPIIKELIGIIGSV